MKYLVLAVSFAASVPAFAHHAIQKSGAEGHATIAVENSRVRAYRTTAGVLEGVAHGPGVVVWLESDSDGSAGRSVWVEDAAVVPKEGAGHGAIVIVQPLDGQAAAPAAPSGSKPGDAPFTGMSFVPLFSNARVSVLHARMDADAREGFHTHASDTVVVHLSGGDIEDTANGKTVVNRWKPGDVEFEARGSSHSARNVGHPVEVILVALNP
jgi:quercetin dioxygenase-like cupin family protein